MSLNASILRDSSIDTHINYDLDTSNDVNTSNDIKLNATILNEHTYSVPDNTLSIKVVCINMCGILSKLRYPDFEEFCQSYDIACIVESKLGSLDSFDIQKFEILHLLNRKKSKSRSGGIAVLVKDTIYKHVKGLNSVMKMCYGLQLKIHCFTSKYYLVQFIYLPKAAHTVT